ncbi:MAG: pirin family protein, partial [Synergistales bacterium]|nr:pirin family protein [Synergistales bacterium]
MENIRKPVKTVSGRRTTDGAGVSLVRVFGHRDVEDFDP